MTRGRVPQVVVKEPTAKITPSEPTLEARIQAAAAQFYSTKSKDVERSVLQTLETRYADLLYETVGFRVDNWSNRITFDDRDRRLRSMAQAQADQVLKAIDFGSVELTVSQINSIKSTYQRVLKEAVVDAARDLAREHSRAVAAKVLGLES